MLPCFRLNSLFCLFLKISRWVWSLPKFLIHPINLYVMFLCRLQVCPSCGPGRPWNQLWGLFAKTSVLEKSSSRPTRIQENQRYVFMSGIKINNILLNWQLYPSWVFSPFTALCISEGIIVLFTTHLFTFLVVLFWFGGFCAGDC